MTTPFPKKVLPLQELAAILLEWNQGESYQIPYHSLRFQCPCAVCVDEHTGKRRIKSEDVSKEVRPIGVSTVGRYALQFKWSDGHQTGIYPFDGLYKICLEFGTRR